MRILTALTFLLLTTLSHTAEWKNQLFGVSATLPSSAGWREMEAVDVPGITLLLSMANPARDAYFTINVRNNAPKMSLRDPQMQKLIADDLKALGYTMSGYSTVRAGDREWLQYPIQANAGGKLLKGVARYTWGGDQNLYAVSFLIGGGKEATQDDELQAAAASVRIPATPPTPTIATTAPAPSQAADSTSTTLADQKPAEVATAAVPEAPRKPDYARYALLGGGGLLILVILLKIIGGGGSKK